MHVNAPLADAGFLQSFTLESVVSNQIREAEPSSRSEGRLPSCRARHWKSEPEVVAMRFEAWRQPGLLSCRSGREVPTVPSATTLLHLHD